MNALGELWISFCQLKFAEQVGLVASLATLFGCLTTAMSWGVRRVRRKAIYSRDFVEGLQAQRNRLELENSALRAANEQLGSKLPAAHLAKLREENIGPALTQEIARMAEELLPIAGELTLHIARDLHAKGDGSQADCLRFARLSQLIRGLDDEESCVILSRVYSALLGSARLLTNLSQREGYLLELARVVTKDSDDVNAIAALARRAFTDRHFVTCEALYTRILKDAGHADPALILNCEGLLAQSLVRQGRAQHALAIFEDVLPRQRTYFGDRHEVTIDTVHEYAHCLDMMNHYSRAKDAFGEAFRLATEALGRNAKSTVRAQYCFGHFLMILGSYDEAVRLLEDHISVMHDHFPNDREALYESMYDLACVYSRLGRQQDCVRMLADVKVNAEKYLGRDHEVTLNASRETAAHDIDEGNYAEAIELLESVIERSERVLGEKHNDTFIAMRRLANAFIGAGKLERAHAWLQTSFQRQSDTRRIFPEFSTTAIDLAKLLIHINRSDEAHGVIRTAVTAMGERLQLGDFQVLSEYIQAARMLTMSLRSVQEAVPIFEASLKAAVDQTGSDSPLSLEIEWDLVCCMIVLTPTPEIFERALRLCDRMRDHLGSEHGLTKRAMAACQSTEAAVAGN